VPFSNSAVGHASGLRFSARQSCAFTALQCNSRPKLSAQFLIQFLQKCPALSDHFAALAKQLVERLLLGFHGGQDVTCSLNIPGEIGFDADKIGAPPHSIKIEIEN
jgi:hypothetical protein